MKQALILVVATFGLAATAFAQAPDTSASPGPHDPNPPMDTPDLRLPPPCAPTSNLAALGATANPGAAQTITPAASRIAVADAGDTQCSANSVTQSALAPAPQDAQ